MAFPELLKLLPLTLPPPTPPPVNFYWFSGLFITFPGLFNFWPPKTPLWPPPPRAGWVKIVCVRMVPGPIRICVPNLVAVRRSCRKRGYIQTHTQKDTAALYGRCVWWRPTKNVQFLMIQTLFFKCVDARYARRCPWEMNAAIDNWRTLLVPSWETAVHLNSPVWYC